MDKDLIGRGWSFPIRVGIDHHLNTESGLEKIKQSIWLILSTAPGERQMLPEFGCGIHDLLFEPNTTSNLRGLTASRVRDALSRWEPRIDVMDVRVESSPEQRNYLRISIDFRIRSTNSVKNLVYPFFINEGEG
jgi:phage baseplate assembly protein W